MKRHLPGLVALMICFAIAGLGSAAVSSRQTVSLCEIAAHPERYHGKVIRVRALIVRDKIVGAPPDMNLTEVGLVLACTGEDEWPSASLDLNYEQVLSLKPNVRVWRDKSDIDADYLSEAIIEGRFDSHDDGVTYCFTSRYELANATLERVISTTRVKRE